jgi:hypothetical protein
MAIATPDTLAAMFGQLIEEAAKQAADKPDELREILAPLGELGNDIKNLPADAFDALKPDMWSLLVFVLVQVAKTDPANLKVGAMQPPGWSRMVTLTYYTDTVDLAQPSITLGLAVLKDTGAGGGELTRGVLLRVSGPIPKTSLPNDPAAPVRVSVEADGAVEWPIPFSQPLAKPAQEAQLTLGISWDPPDPTVPGFEFSTGPADATVVLDSHTGAELYNISVGLGSSSPPPAGVRVAVNPDLGVLGKVVSIAAIDERYSPRFTHGQKTPATFTLNHNSA